MYYNEKNIRKIIVSLALIVCMLPIDTLSGTYSSNAKVWAGAPLIGHAYIYTPYTITYSGKGTNKKISKITTGKNYKGSGITVFSYYHYRTWGDITGKKTHEINASGICDAIVKGSAVSLGKVTFLYKGTLK